MIIDHRRYHRIKAYLVWRRIILKENKENPTPEYAIAIAALEEEIRKELNVAG